MPSYPEILLEMSVVRPGSTWGVDADVRQTGPYDTLVIETTDGFEVCDITVAGATQFATTTPIPAAAFAPGAAGIRLALGVTLPRWLPAGTRVGIRVKNLTEEIKPFRAKLIVAPDSP